MIRGEAMERRRLTDSLIYRNTLTIIVAPLVLLLAGCVNSVRKAGNEVELNSALITTDVPAEVVDGFNAWQLYGTVPKDWVDYRTFSDGREFRFFKQGNRICIVSQVYGWRRCYQDAPYHVAQSGQLVVVLEEKTRCAPLIPSCALKKQTLEILEYQTGKLLARYQLIIHSPGDPIILNHALIRGKKVYFQLVPRKLDILPSERRTYCIDIGNEGN
jgi:hypothetical protein